jgi:hypothetical protein
VQATELHTLEEAVVQQGWRFVQQHYRLPADPYSLLAAWTSSSSARRSTTSTRKSIPASADTRPGDSLSDLRDRFRSSGRTIGSVVRVGQLARAGYLDS